MLRVRHAHPTERVTVDSRVAVWQRATLASGVRFDGRKAKPMSESDKSLLDLLSRLIEVVAAMVSFDDCEIEHGECQAHGWYVEDGASCWNAVVLALLEEADEVRS